MLTVDTRDLEDLRRVLRAAPKEIRQGIQMESKRWAPLLVRAAQTGARGEVDKKIAQSAQTRIMAKGLVVRFGATGRIGKDPLSEVTRPHEFGQSNPEAKTRYTGNRRGKNFPVVRRSQKQIPRAQSDGRFLYPAIARCTPQLVSRYVKLIADSVSNA